MFVYFVVAMEVIRLIVLMKMGPSLTLQSYYLKDSIAIQGTIKFIKAVQFFRYLEDLIERSTTNFEPLPDCECLLGLNLFCFYFLFFIIITPVI